MISATAASEVAGRLGTEVLGLQVLDHDPVDFTHLLGGQRRELAPAETMHGSFVARRRPPRQGHGGHWV